MFTPLNDQYPGSSTYMPEVVPARTANLSNEDDDKYVFTSKIMVMALTVLFAVVFFVICLHIYAKWIWSANPADGRARGPISFWFWSRRRRNRSSPGDAHGDQAIIDADVNDINMVVGLGKSAVEALPTFMYKIANHVESTEINTLECAICLGNFKEDEIGRVLPNCGHSFHLECIDMWLYSHATCPLCRAVLEPEEDESISLNFEAASIHVFPVEPTDTPRRLLGMNPDHNFRPQVVQGDQMDEQSDESTQQPQPSQTSQDQETANKRADSIPANVLFWGNQTQQNNANSTLSTTFNTSLQAPFQVAIDIDIPRRPLDQQTDNTPASASHSDSTVAPIPLNFGSFRRLLG